MQDVWCESLLNSLPFLQPVISVLFIVTALENESFQQPQKFFFCNFQTVGIAEASVLWPKHCFLPFWVSAPSHDSPRACSSYTQTGHKISNREHNILCLTGWVGYGMWQWHSGETNEKPIRKGKKPRHRTERTDNICTKENVTTYYKWFSQKKKVCRKARLCPIRSWKLNVLFLKTCDYGLGTHREVIGF